MLLNRHSVYSDLQRQGPVVAWGLGGEEARAPESSVLALEEEKGEAARVL